MVGHMNNMNTASKPSSKSSSTTTDSFDRSEWSRLQALVKAEMQGVIYDSERARPLYSKSKDEAVAKRDAIIKAFGEFLTMVESIKRP